MKSSRCTGQVTFSDCKPIPGPCGAILSAVLPCHPTGAQYLEWSNALQFDIPTNYLILMCFLVGITAFSFLSMRAAVVKKAKSG